MNNKKLILLGICAIVLVVFVFVFRKSGSSLHKKDINFAFKKDISKIERILIEGDKVFELNKINSEWLVDNKIKANDQKVSNLFFILDKIQMTHPASNELEKTLIDYIQNDGSKIELFCKNKSVYKLQYSKYNNSYVALNRYNKPYFIELNGYNHIPIYEILSVDENDWKENMLLNVTSNEIKQIQLRYKYDSSRDFMLITSNPITIKDSEGEVVLKLSINNALDYLHFFEGIEYSVRDTIKYIANYSIQLFDFEMIQSDNTKITISGFPLFDKTSNSISVSHFEAVINNLDSVMINYSLFDPILVTKDYFLKK
jgi:hypothetical protein